MTQPRLSDHGIFTRKQLCEDLKLDDATLARWEEDHNFPGRAAGRTTFYDVQAIRKWIASKPKDAQAYSGPKLKELKK
jgi:hypothetical protein